MILWHVSFDPVDEFVPRVPTQRVTGEDDKTPRICFSEHISRAVSAMPHGGQALRGMLSVKKRITPVLYAYACEADETFIPPERVQNEFGVPDAMAVREWWATKTVIPDLRLLQVFGAVFEEGVDALGNNGVWVRAIDYDLIPELPADAPFVILGNKGFSIRQAMDSLDSKRREGKAS